MLNERDFVVSNGETIGDEQRRINALEGLACLDPNFCRGSEAHLKLAARSILGLMRLETR